MKQYIQSMKVQLIMVIELCFVSKYWFHKLDWNIFYMSLQYLTKREIMAFVDCLGHANRPCPNKYIF